MRRGAEITVRQDSIFCHPIPITHPLFTNWFFALGWRLLFWSDIQFSCHVIAAAYTVAAFILTKDVCVFREREFSLHWIGSLRLKPFHILTLSANDQKCLFYIHVHINFAKTLKSNLSSLVQVQYKFELFCMSIFHLVHYRTFQREILYFFFN